MGRTQTETITVRVTPEEKYAIQERMYEAVAPSMRQFVMDMCLDGEIAVNGCAYAPFILTVDWLGWVCYLPDKLEFILSYHVLPS